MTVVYSASSDVALAKGRDRSASAALHFVPARDGRVASRLELVSS